MSVVNHWGKWVSDNVPVGGVVNTNRLDYDYIDAKTVIDLRFEEGATEFIRSKQSEFIATFWDNLPDDDTGEYVDPIPSDDLIAEWEGEYNENSFDQIPARLLVGSWVQDSNGLWDVDRDGEFAAIVDYDSMTAQIVYSQWVTRGALCSPCYPGQVDLGTPGEYMGYDFPPDMYDGEDFADRNAPQLYAPYSKLEYTVVVQVCRVINGIPQTNVSIYEEENLFYATVQAPRGDLRQVTIIAQNVWNIADDQLRSIPR